MCRSCTDRSDGMVGPVRWRHVRLLAPETLLCRLRQSDRTFRVPGSTDCGPRNRQCGRARSSGHQIRKLLLTESERAPRLPSELEYGAVQFEDRVARAGPLRSSCRLVNLDG